jgi:hypothetical protein
VLTIDALPATFAYKIELRKWDLQGLHNGDRKTYIEMRTLEARHSVAHALFDALLELQGSNLNGRKLDVTAWMERREDNIDAPNGGALVITAFAKIELVPEGDVYFYEVERPATPRWQGQAITAVISHNPMADEYTVGLENGHMATIDATILLPEHSAWLRERLQAETEDYEAQQSQHFPPED